MSPKRILIALLLSIVLILGLGYLAGSQLTIQGNFRLLNSIQKIRNGKGKEEVRNLMDGDPTVFEATLAPAWITDQTGPKNEGEFWSYFMGFPPRNLIIYFDAEGDVVFTTWAPT